jgi:hypothetical protein
VSNPFPDGTRVLVVSKKHYAAGMSGTVEGDPFVPSLLACRMWRVKLDSMGGHAVGCREGEIEEIKTR